MRTPSRRFASTGLAVALLALAACSDDRSFTNEDLDATAWVSSSVEGETLVEGTQIDLAFQDGQIAVNAGCNTMNGAYTLDNETLLVRNMAQTLQGCPDDLTAQDQWVLGLLESQPRLSLGGDELTMRGAEVDVTVVFDRASP